MTLLYSTLTTGEYINLTLDQYTDLLLQTPVLASNIVLDAANSNNTVDEGSMVVYIKEVTQTKDTYVVVPDTGTFNTSLIQNGSLESNNYYRD